MFYEWDIYHVMDTVLQRARDNNWFNFSKINQEYSIFVEDDQKDTQEAMLNGVDMSNANSLFSKDERNQIIDRCYFYESFKTTSW